jgi:hypothetical protein
MNKKYSSPSMMLNRKVKTTIRSAWQVFFILAFLASLVGVAHPLPARAETLACTDIELVAAEDTYMSASDVQYNNGGNTSIHVDGTTGTSRRGALMKWDLSSIPSGATISTASLRVNVTTASALVFNMYNMRRSWVEGTSTQANSTTSANWNTYDGATSWGTVGAANTSSDRYDTNMWGADATSFASTGSKTVSLNSNGISVLQGWLTTPASNYGVAIQNYSGSTADAVFFDSSEATTAANRPTLLINYCTGGTTPTITTTGSLSAFSTTTGTPSAAQTYTVAGSNLTANIAITAPSGFNVSTSSGSGYAASLTLTQSGGTVATTTIYARLTGASAGSFSGNITHTSTGATTANVAASGTVSSSGCTDVSLVAAEDTYMSANDVTFNNGGGTSIHVDNNTTTGRRGALMKWDLSSIPSGATINTASLQVNVTDASSLVFNMYNMRRSWVEGTSDRAASTTSANWNTYDGATSWGTVGAANTSSDRYDTNLWGADSSSFASTGSKTVSLNSSGISALQGWLNTPSSNYGVTIQNYSGSTTNAVFFDSSENSTAANRPTLLINYCTGSTTPTITTTGTLSAFSTTTGTPSAAQTYTAAGSNLTANITVTAPSGFNVSLSSGSGYASTLTLTQSGGTVATTTIYARLTGASAGPFSGNITHASSGATTANVAASGTVTAPTPTITTTGTLSAFSTTPGTPSAAQSYTVAGANLTANIVITPPAGFEISLSSGSGYASTLTLTQSGGTVATTTIYARLTGASAGSFSGNITHTSSGATTANVPVSGTVTATPTITTTGTLSAFSTTTGTPSAAQTYTVSGSGLSADIAITAPSGFNVSLSSGSGYASSLTLTQSGGAVATTTIYARLTGASAGPFSGNITHASTGATTANVPVSGTVTAPTPTITTTGTLSAFSTTVGTASAAQTYTVAGSNLTANITVTAPSGFNVSTSSGSGYATSLTLTQSGGTVATTTIYARLTGASAGSFSGNITHASTGATTANVAVSGTVSTPTITTTGTLSAFSTTTGTPSAAQTYTVAGSGLTANIVITAPSGYNISLSSGSGYASTLTLTQSGGTVATTTIYARLTGAGAGTFSGNITHTSTGATTANVAVTGTVSSSTCTDVSLVAAEDTYMSANDVQYNNGGNTSIHVDNNTTTGRRGALMKWDLSSIPSGATINTASIVVNVTDASSLVFNLYNMRRSWVEGTSSQANSTTSANWNTYDGAASWGTVGAANTSSDRYDTNLWGADTSSFASTGSKSVSLNSSGISVLQGWLNTPSTNYGVTIQNYTGSTTNAVFFDSSENSTTANRPKMNINYCTGSTGPTITTTGTLSAFSTAPGTPSAAQTYTVAGSGLTANIVITAPSGYEISLSSGSGYATSLTLTQSGGTVATTTIYARLTGASAGSFSGNITHTSTGATTANVAVSGTVSSTPTITVTGSLSAFSTTVGTASTAQTYTVSGSALTANIVITAPSGFNVSLSSGSGYASTLTLTQSGGTVATTTIYARLTGASAGSFSGNITHTSTGATTANVAVSGTVSSSTCTDVSLVAAEDTYMSANDVQYNNGGNTSIHVDGTTGTSRRGALMKWDVSSIPNGATVTAASIVVNVTDASSLVFNLYNMRRSWVEGTSSQANSTTSANWNTYDGAASWGTVGAANTSSDRFDTNLWGADTSSFASTGSRTVSLNSDGLAVIQGWLSGSANNGLAIQNYSGSTANAVFFDSSENSTTANRPKMNITYCTGGTTPTIVASGTLNAFSTAPGTPSAAQTYTVSGSNLTANIVITAPSGFEISLSSGSGYASTLTLTQSGGTVASTTLYARLTGASAGTFSGNITHTSSGATTVNKAVSGTVSSSTCTDVSLTASEDTYLSANDVTFNNGGNTELHVNGMTDTNRRTTLMKWDLSSIPSGATIQTVSLALNVTDASPLVFNLYNMRRSWVEGTSSRAASTNSANWNTYDGATSWGTVGAANTSSDRYDTNLWAADTSTFASTGSKTVSLNSNGISVVQGWLSTPANNFGLIFQNYTGTTNNAVYFSSSENTTEANRPKMNINYCTGTGNKVPNAPVLVQPTDNATGISTSPTLQVTASDPDTSDSLSVSFYGRPVGTSTGADFMIVAIPDAQNYATSYPSTYTNHLKWIADNKSANNIVFATSVGDLVNTATSSTEYANADTAYDTLDAGSVAYSVGPGNHDMASGTLWANNFGTSRFSGKSYYGGSYDNYNNYYLFSASGMDFILINLQYSPTTAVLDWADARLKQYPSRRAIVEVHDILNTDNSWANQAAYTALRDNDNLFLMLCGHMHTTNDGAAYVAGTGTGTAAQTIHIVMQDYQDFTGGGNGYLRLYRFSPANNLIYMTTYSPTASSSITTDPDQRNLAYSMGGSGGADYTLIGTVSGVANGANASISWTGRASNTEYEWYAVVSDGKASTTGSTWSFTTGQGANNAPVITQGTSTSVTMSEDGSPTAFSLTLNATDADNDTLTWSISTAAAHGTAGASGTGLSKAITFTPTANYNGTDSFVVQVSDGKTGGTDTITVNVTISAVNDAPTATAQSVTTNEDTAIAITLAGTDVDGDSLTYAISASPAHGALSGTAPNVTFTPTANYNGSDSFSFTVSDGTATSAAATVSITITAVNDTPVANAQSVTTNEDIALAMTLSGTDAEGSTLTFAIGASPTHGTLSGTAPNVTYTPAANYNGSDSFTFTVNDGSLTSAAATVSITVAAVNDAPVANAQTVAATQGVAQAITLSGSDVEGATLTYAIASSPAHGTLTGTPPNVTYTAAADYVGTDSFTFTVNDGALTSPAATVTINVSVLNIAPVANAQSVNTNEDTAVGITLIASDSNGDALTYSVVANPAHGALSGTPPNLTYTPAANYNGADSFAFKANDGKLDSNIATVTITVASVNDAPVLGAIGNKTVNELVLLSFTATATDDGGSLSYSLTGAPAGAAIDAASGVFTWTPTEAQGPSSSTFDVCVSDGSFTDCETITVVVNEANQAPVLNPIGNLSGWIGGPLTFTASATDGDIPANTLTFSLVGAPAGASINPTTGVFTWTPAAAGTFTFNVVVSDGTTTDFETITAEIAANPPTYYLFLPHVSRNH